MYIDMSTLLIGVMLGIAGMVMLYVSYQIVKSNFEIEMLFRVRKHEEKYHAKELEKERKNK